jgi:hypothetical protein
MTIQTLSKMDAATRQLHLRSNSTSRTQTPLVFIPSPALPTHFCGTSSNTETGFVALVPKAKMSNPEVEISWRIWSREPRTS